MRGQEFCKEWSLLQDTICGRNLPLFSLRIGTFKGSSLSCASIHPTHLRQGKNPNLVSLIRKIIEVAGRYVDTSDLYELEHRADLLGKPMPSAPEQKAAPSATCQEVETGDPKCPQTVTELFDFVYQPVVYDTCDDTEITGDGYVKRMRYANATQYCCLALDPQAENKSASPLELQVSKKRLLPDELIKKYGLPCAEFTFVTAGLIALRFKSVNFKNSIPNSEIEEIAFAARISPGWDRDPHLFKIIFTCSDQLIATKIHILISSLFDCKKIFHDVSAEKCTLTCLFNDQQHFIDAMRFIVQQHTFDNASRRAFMDLLNYVLLSSKERRHLLLADYLKEFMRNIEDNRKVTVNFKD